MPQAVLRPRTATAPATGRAAATGGHARRRACLVRSVSLAIAVAALVLPAGAGAEQASDPSSPAAGTLDLGRNDSCAVLGDGGVRCWGYGGDGELGHGNRQSVGVSDTPAALGPVDLGAGVKAKAVSAGGYHTCALLDDGSVACWGFGGNGRLGYGNSSSVGDGSPDLGVASVGRVDLGAGHTASAITAGGAHTCAIRDDGSILCWGYGFDGQLGYGDTNQLGDPLTPGASGPIDLGAHVAKAISAGDLHTCAILDDGSVRCWGFGATGRLGYGNAGNVGDGAPDPSVASAGPIDLGPGRTARAISAGGAHTCVILDTGAVLCWGYGGDGQLGYGDTNSVGAVGTPGTVGPVDLGAGHTARAISAGEDHTCAILDDGTVRCWGFGGAGRLGYGNTGNVGDGSRDPSVAAAGPVDLGGQPAMAISAGGSHTCALLRGGAVRCWGYGGNGRLGYCGEGNVGDVKAGIPGSAGPVNLTPGDGGEPCGGHAPANSSPPSISGRAIEWRTLSESHGSWAPSPTTYAYQWQRCDAAGGRCVAIAGASAQSYRPGASDVGATIRVLETAGDRAGSGRAAVSSTTAVVAASPALLAEAARTRGFHGCLASVAARARATAHHGSAGRRRLVRRLAEGRARCVRAFGRTPGRVTGVRVVARGSAELRLEFTAPGTDGHDPPAAVRYLVKQSLHPIRDRRDFAAARALCRGACHFAVSALGTRLRLTITALRPHTTYYYAVAALDNVTARPGPPTRAVRARTG